ncbi:MAG: hypothetical protein AAF399_17000 [Bacteroidota bacterium]
MLGQETHSNPEWRKFHVYGQSGVGGVLNPWGYLGGNVNFHTFTQEAGLLHYGFGIGAFAGQDIWNSASPIFGGTAYFQLWIGEKNHHFETRFGGILLSIPEVPYAPLLQFGYRFQRPYRASFWFLHAGTGGFSVGGGMGL